jgi:hypothetical protein
MPEPDKVSPLDDWEHLKLWERVTELFYALPSSFKTELVVRGINVTEIFSVGSAFATVIESQVVSILNGLRDQWDPDEQYLQYSFLRQSQTFPDVLLKNTQQDEAEESEESEQRIIFGIELKSWYVLAKEGEPSFRYKITPEACADVDMLVIIPWILSEVISGTPRLLTPYVISAKYAAQYRNWYWQRSRKESGGNTKITPPPNARRHPYPDSKKKASDKAEDDDGNNFGRVSRAGVFDEYLKTIKAQDYMGIKIHHWIYFFKAISETNTDTQINKKIEALKKQIQEDPAYTDADEDKARYKESFLQVLDRLEDVWNRIPD